MIEELIKNAEADIELLKQNDLKGDQFDKPRQVDFLFKSPTREKAEAIAGFLSDYNFGNTNITQNENQFEPHSTTIFEHTNKTPLFPQKPLLLLLKDGFY